jgi:nucleotide-binding universal stress UspA family protein
MTPIKNILHPTDFSRPCEVALQIACTLASAPDTRLILLHVVPCSVLRGSAAAPNGASGRSPRNYKAYWEEMRRKLQDLPLPGLKARVEHVLAEGGPAAAILRAANEHSCDLIVMGTHGWTGMARRIIGSVAEEVMQLAPCPVVMVRVPLAERPSTDETAPEEVGVIL